jgi:hypothetical protein
MSSHRRKRDMPGHVPQELNRGILQSGSGNEERHNKPEPSREEARRAAKNHSDTENPGMTGQPPGRTQGH